MVPVPGPERPSAKYLPDTVWFPALRLSTETYCPEPSRTTICVLWSTVTCTEAPGTPEMDREVVATDILGGLARVNELVAGEELRLPLAVTVWVPLTKPLVGVRLQLPVASALVVKVLVLIVRVMVSPGSALPVIRG